MLKALFRRKPERDRIESSPVSEHLDPFAVALASQKYPTRTIGRYVFAADRFGRWLVARGQIVGQIDDHVVDEYLLSVGRTRRAGWPRGRLPTSAFGARRFVEFLRRSGVMAMADAGAPESEVDRWVAFYDQHLERVAGLCGGTRRRYCSYARRLIVFCLGEQRLDWSALGADRIAEFVGQEAAKLNPAGSRGPVTAVRAVIRYLVSQGSVRAGLDGAVPTVRQWRHASLPEGLSVDEVQRVLSLCESGDDVATRDRAILLLLARLGLRAGEVAGLDIEHIHWSRGEILVAAGKSGRDRLLPLSEEVGAALVAYLIYANAWDTITVEYS